MITITQNPVIERGLINAPGASGVHKMRDMMAEARKMWDETWQTKDAKLDTNVDQTYDALHRLNQLWQQPWAPKQLRLETPAAPWSGPGRAPFPGGPLSQPMS